MGWISRTGLVAAGYLLGARAGTDRYDQIIAAGQRVLARPELQRYLTPLTDRLHTSTPGGSPGPAPGASAGAPVEVPTAAPVGVPPLPPVPPAAVAPGGELPDPVPVVAPPEPPPTPLRDARPPGGGGPGEHRSPPGRDDGAGRAGRRTVAVAVAVARA